VESASYKSGVAEMVKKTRDIQRSDVRVLVVDDVLSNLMMAKGLMEPYGMNIYLVKNGQKAVDLIREGKIRFNAIFMDHLMPGMDGIEAVRIIREMDSEYAKTVPIIALTANVSRENADMFLGHGFQDFLSKPIDIFEMEKILLKWVAC
jgi:CheY-like chemotaxis protein